ncbi:PEPxxWA-CTERM sorting domain-containing protein [Phenylobacterium sp.]|uniref:PEPxxWA-CTERM sorting domain-containing protein n=1 Tax=Phenylobacterium sp. TaxID=1871053 RepID=UPI002EDAFF57
MTLSAPRAPQRLIAILLACAVATPSVAAVDCYEQMSRIPTASAAPAPVGYRASMLRGGPLAAASPSKTPAAHRPARKVTRKAKGPRTAAVVRKAKGSGKKAVVRKAYAKGGPAKRARRAVVAAPAVGPLPTPPAVAARNIAALREFALVKTTICTTIAPPAIIVAPPIEPETVTVLPPLGPPDLETFDPDITVRPPTDFVVVVRPPRPPGPPALVPLPRPVPEPGTWLLLILGFGVLGARLRARRAAVD